MSRNPPEIETNTPEIMLLGAFRFDPVNAELRNADGSPIPLRSQSLEVLRVLAQHRGEVVKKDDLMATVWGDTFVTDDSLVQCISDIRRALGDSGHTLVQTLPRRGYRLNHGPETAMSSAKTNYSHRRSIFVQPFTSIGPETDQTVFTEGLSEDLIARLSMVRNLTVVAARSSYSFQNDALRANQSDVDGSTNVLMGSVRISGNKVRVTAQLVERQGGAVLFSRRYDRELKDVFAIQDDIASNIIAETRVALTEGEAARLAYRQTRSVQAWEYFHQGVLEYFKYTAEGNAAARSLYQRALAEDLNYFDARVAEAWTHFIDARPRLVADPANSLATCRKLVDRIIATSPEVTDIIQLDAMLLLLEGNYDAAVMRADAAYVAGPSFLYSRGTTAWVHLYAGNLSRACEIYRERLNADPYFGDDALFYYAQCLSLLGEHEEAVSLAKEYRRRVPGTVYGYTLLATAQGLAGQKDAAKETVAALRLSHPQFSLEIFRRHEPFREDQILEKLASQLRDAGLPN